jgi:hypothetical protein
MNLLRFLAPVLAPVVALASTCALPGAAKAWDAGGHMIAAQIALGQLSPEKQARANKLVSLAPDFRAARAGRKPRAYDFVSLASWMDDVRPSGKRDALATWHYINLGCEQEPDEVTEQNALDALNLAGVVLRSDAADKDKAEWLAIALHIIGDLHQPLHASSRERGGNDFWIRGAPGVEARITRAGKRVDRARPATGTNAGYFQNLHALWDSGYRVDAVKQGTKRAKVSLYDIGYSDAPDMARVAKLAAEVPDKYLRGRPNITSDAKVWAKESSQIACEWAYETPRGGIVSADYIEKLHDVSCTRLALAGLRMGRWLDENLK